MLLPIPAASCSSAIRACSASSPSAGGFCCDVDASEGPALSLPPSAAPARLSSAALPKDKARRSLEVLLFNLPPFWLMAASCLTAGLSNPAFDDSAAPFGVDGLAGAAAESLDPLEPFSASIVTGFDSGDGLAIRLAASDEELLGGILTSFGESGFVEVWSEDSESWAGFPVGVGTLLRWADWIHKSSACGHLKGPALHRHCDWIVCFRGWDHMETLTEDGLELLLRLETRLSELPFFAPPTGLLIVTSLAVFI